MTTSNNPAFIDYLKKIKFFASLSDLTLMHFINELEPLTLSAGEILFSQGDAPDAIYILANGRLIASLNLPSGDERVVGYIESGEIVGELGVMTNNPRALTISAIEECNILKLPQDKFQHLIKNYPEIACELVSFLAMRSQNLIKLLGEHLYRHVAVIPANGAVDFSGFIQTMKDNFAPFQKSSELIIETEHVEKGDLEKLSNFINDAEQMHKGLIFMLSSPDTEFAKLCLRKSNSILIVNEEQINAEKSIDPSVLKLISMEDKIKNIHIEFLLIHPEKRNYYLNTRFWLDNQPFDICYHMAKTSQEDIARTLRLMTGNGIGLVLGGGGAKAWAEIGVLKAIEELNIKIDALGGASAGAIIAAASILYNNFDEAFTNLLYITTKVSRPFSMKNFTLPIISILNGSAITNSLKKVFGDIYIEDLEIPFFTNSSNLTTGQINVHRFGPLWLKLRATVSLPGLVPPVTLDGEIHVDGGLLNNLPIDVMREGLMGSGKIIAVSLSNRDNLEENKIKYNFPMEIPFKKSVLIALGIGGKDYCFPPFFDTFLSSLLLGASKQEYLNSLEADVLISPPLYGYTLLSWRAEQIKKVMQIGYEETIKLLSHLTDVKNISNFKFNFRRKSLFSKFLRNFQ